MAAIPDIIERRKPYILERWLEGTRQTESARGLSRPQLMDVLPLYLSSLGRSTDVPTAEQRSMLENHLSRRIRQGFEMHEVLVEFTILSRVLAEVIAEVDAADRPASVDVARLFHELQLASIIITQIFTEHLMEDEQLEKRFARLIQDVVSETVHAGNGGLPLRERLSEVLTLVSEALEADAAALLLYDARSERLITTASTGIADGSLEQYTAAVPPASFVGTVATTEGSAVLVLDTQTAGLDVGESLRKTGLRSLLGVRLRARNDLIGVLFVGAREKRDFSPSEVRRLESLGARLTLHLENAQLYAKFRDQRDQLHLFVDVLAHDLRGPLALARSATGLVERSLRHADRVVTDLLDAHRIDAGETLQLKVADSAVDTLFEDVAEEATLRYARRVIVHSDGRSRGAFDGEQVRRAARILIEHALEYGDPRSPVTVRSHGAEHGLVVEVHIDGPAIPRDEVARLFEPFARARAATKRVAAGWALGLPLVAACASAHGGSVDVRSEPGEGTTFRLSIPWQQLPREEPAPSLH